MTPSIASLHQENEQVKIQEIIRDSQAAMLVTDAADGLRGRPMLTLEREFDGTLWFFTAESSPKADEIATDRKVQLSYMNPDKNRYLSISGSAVIHRDNAKIKELWTPRLKTWFPKGTEDPDLALLKVTVTEAEYWDGTNQPIQVTF